MKFITRFAISKIIGISQSKSIANVQNEIPMGAMIANTVIFQEALYKTTSKFIPDFYAVKSDWAWMIYPWSVIEDLIKLILKIMQSDSRSWTIDEIINNLKGYYDIDIDENKVVKALLQMEIRNKIKKDRLGWIMI